jgi:hypothetical protein
MAGTSPSPPRPQPQQGRDGREAGPRQQMPSRRPAKAGVQTVAPGLPATGAAGGDGVTRKGQGLPEELDELQMRLAAAQRAHLHAASSASPMDSALTWFWDAEQDTLVICNAVDLVRQSQQERRAGMERRQQRAAAGRHSVAAAGPAAGDRAVSARAGGLGAPDPGEQGEQRQGAGKACGGAPGLAEGPPGALAGPTCGARLAAGTGVTGQVQPKLGFLQRRQPGSRQ